MPQCKRSGNTFKCKNLSMQDVRRAHQKFYERPNRESQNNFILQHITVSSPTPSDSKKQLITKFNISMRRDSKTENVRVCREAFLSILQVGRDRVHRLCEQFFKTDLAPLEKRGGDRRTEKYKEKKEAIMTHIKTFVPLQSHYSRGRKCMRQYLDSDLSIKNLWSLFTVAYPDLVVAYDYHRSVFCENFNIGFGSPAVDKCSTCTSLESRINVATGQEKKELIVQMNAHKARSNVFFEKLRQDNESELTLSYDCQKNLVLPKVPDQAAYYSRQLYLYNFSICQGSSHSPQNTTNTFSYCWTENEFMKGSNEIASALYHRLQNSDG